MVERIRFALGLFSDKSIKKKNNPAIKGLKDDRGTELLDVSIEKEVRALIENKQKKRVIKKNESERVARFPLQFWKIVANGLCFK